MIISQSTSIGPKEIEDGLFAAYKLFDKRWLQSQYERRTTDPLLFDKKSVVSPQFSINAIKYGTSGDMHPIAEAVKVGEAIIGQYKKDNQLLGSRLLYLLMSLRDVVRMKDKIANVQERLVRLKTPEWKPALYELLVAASYTNLGRVEFINEGSSPTPDFKVTTDRQFYVECKAKVQFQENVIRFIKQATRDSLGRIAEFVWKVDAGFLIKITLKVGTSTKRIPEIVEQMIRDGKRIYSSTTVLIEITPFSPEEVVPRKTMSAMSEEFWEWVFEFKEWAEWHYCLPGGDFQFSNLSNGIVKKVKRPVLICVRAEALSNNTQNILNTLKDGCRKQFRAFQPGILHLLMNTNLFALGDRRKPTYIEQVLSQTAAEVFRNYNRVCRITADIITPPRWGEYSVDSKRVSYVNQAYDLSGMEPSPIVLF